MFELITPDNTIVVKYKKAAIILTGMNPLGDSRAARSRFQGSLSV